MRKMNPVLAVILGSGLDSILNFFQEKKVIADDGSGIHPRKVYHSNYRNSELILFSGRKHFYEGYSKDEVLSNVRLVDKLGVKNLVITNAAGGLNENFEVSDIM